MMVVCYIYFTRIIVFLLSSTLPCVQCPNSSGEGGRDPPARGPATHVNMLPRCHAFTIMIPFFNINFRY